MASLEEKNVKYECTEYIIKHEGGATTIIKKEKDENEVQFISSTFKDEGTQPPNEPRASLFEDLEAEGIFYPALEIPRDKPFPCQYCDYRAATKSNLQQHIKGRHFRPVLKCSKCDFTTLKELTLKQHTKMKHTRKNSYKCSECGFASLKKLVLESHIKQVHSKDQLYKCELCNYSSTYPTRVKQHTNLKHKSDCLLKCPFCPFTNTNKHIIKAHASKKHGKEI